MDLSMLKQKLDTLQSKPQGGQKTDYTTIFWRPTVGKQQIRIVPSAFNSSNPFTELKFYYGITNKVMISPLNFDEKDPIALFAQKLREGEYNKENYVLAKKLDAKTRTFVPVVVRGEEDKGVRLWQFGKQVYEELLALAVDDEIGDYTDIVNGRDITVETVGPESTGTPYNKSSVRVRLKTTSLSEDASLVEKWTSEQPNPTDGLFKRYSFDEMKSALEKWLSPEEDSEEVVAAPVAPSTSTSNNNFSLDTTKSKQNKADAFDSMFDEGKKVNEVDDLPF
jgi:6-pyruvoyl-tetrahydropterin synthase